MLLGVCVPGNAGNGPATKTSNPIQVGGPGQPVEAEVQADPARPSLYAHARVTLGDVEAGPATVDVAPRVFSPGNDPSSSQSSDDQGSDQTTHVAPANVYV